MTAGRRPAALLASAWLLAGLAGCELGDGASPGTGAEPTPPTCTVSLEPIDGGPSFQMTATGFEPDRSATLTVSSGELSETLLEADFPALRTDIRGVVRFQLHPGRDHAGPNTVDVAAGGCTARASIEIAEGLFPPACPAGEPVASGGPEAAAYEALVLEDRPIAYWRFEEADGPLAIATVGGDGAYQGEPAFGQPGALTGSRSVTLGGDGDWIDTADLVLAGDLSVEGWISACGDPIDNGDGLFSEDGDAGANLNLFAAEPRFWSGTTDQGDIVWAGSEVVHARWYHLAVTRSGGVMTLYLDGVAVHTGSYAEPITVGALGIGNGATAAQLDEIAIYDRALTPGQLAAHVATAG